jgi:putative sporulation protein YtaF
MLSEILLTLIVCVDIYFVAVNYGVQGIRIPALSAIVIGIVGAGMLGLSLAVSRLLTLFIPTELCSLIGFFMLTAIGIITIFKSIMRVVVRRLTERGDICVKMNSIGLGIRLYLDDTYADEDKSKELSVREAITLAAVLSLDSIATGINSGFLQVGIIRTSIFALVMGVMAINLGVLTGKRLSELKYDFSWLSGIMLIILAVIGCVK